MAKPTGNPPGRPRKAVNLKTVEELASFGCTHQEIASFLKVSVDTLARREGFAEAFTRGFDNCKISLRRAQLKTALAGNSRMLVWCGMQILNQRNKTNQELSGPDGAPIQVQDLTKLNDADLHQLESLLAKAAVAPAGESGTCTAQSA